jgi:hypothetical protein
MPVKITIDIFSGRPNPSIELDEGESADLLGRVRPANAITEESKRLAPLPTLGYRGLIIEQVGTPGSDLPRTFRYAHGQVFGEELAHEASDQAVEDFVCGSTGLVERLKMGPEFSEFALREIGLSKERIARLEPRIRELYEIIQWPWWPCRWWWPCYWWCWRRCRCAPLYEPECWNDGGTVQYNNNCYNYGTNYRTDTYAQPGEASSHKWTDLSACVVGAGEISAKEGAVSDGLVDVPGADNRCPSEGHLVALVIKPGTTSTWDYHWYRKGRNRYWSHKMGWSPATNLDNSGAAIADPRSADRGAYTDFCTFMNVRHGHFKIT